MNGSELPSFDHSLLLLLLLLLLPAQRIRPTYPD
jgi:hypothetical protein